MTQSGAAHVVAVGVDVTVEALEAARYAAAVARDRGWDLMVVHGYLLPPATPGMSAAYFTRTRTDAEALVDEVLAGLRLGPRTEVIRVITAAGRVATLRDITADVSLLVLGRHHFDLADQLLTGRVGTAVAARARCPVVVVPPGWSRRREDGAPMVVALDVETPAEPALRLAFDEAERRRTEVVALHAVPSDGHSSFSEEQASLEEMLAGVKQDHPDVRVRTLLLPGDPRERIVEESRRAVLMVVGRPHRENRCGSWSRSVARAVMDRSFCPLLVAPPAGPATRGGSLSGSGTASRG